ncbi:MAG: hypothetical protein AAFO04_19535 [Cyanobacteria bacterium J06592_8]
MPTVAAYHALRDGSFTLSPNGSQSIIFNPANDMRRDGDINRPVLCYRVDPSNASSLRLTVQSNGQNVGPRLSISGEKSETFMEIMPFSAVGTGNNNITFELGSTGTGSLAISDVIVWFMRSI